MKATTASVGLVFTSTTAVEFCVARALIRLRQMKPAAEKHVMTSETSVRIRIRFQSISNVLYSVEPTLSVSILSYDPESQMDRSSSLDHLGCLELDMLAPEVLEQSRAAPEQHGYEVNPDLVHQIRPDVLLPDLRTAHDADVLVAGGGLRLLQGPLDPVGHEGVYPTLGNVIGNIVRDNEHRYASGACRTVRSPPPHRGVVRASAGDRRPFCAHSLGQEFAVSVVGAAESPLVEALTALAHRFLRANVRRGDKPIQ